MTKNTNATKNNETEASEAKKEYHIKKVYLQKMVLEFPLYVTLKTSYVYFSNPPTHSKRRNDVLRGNMNMDVAPKKPQIEKKQKQNQKNKKTKKTV